MTRGVVDVFEFRVFLEDQLRKTDKVVSGLVADRSRAALHMIQEAEVRIKRTHEALEDRFRKLGKDWREEVENLFESGLDRLRAESKKLAVLAATI